MCEQSERHATPAAIYSITVDGQLTPRWSDWFDGFTVTAHSDGTTTLVGAVQDQPALYGIISRLRDLGLTLLRVERSHTSADK